MEFRDVDARTCRVRGLRGLGFRAAPLKEEAKHT